MFREEFNEVLKPVLEKLEEISAKLSEIEQADYTSAINRTLDSHLPVLIEAIYELVGKGK